MLFTLKSISLLALSVILLFSKVQAEPMSIYFEVEFKFKDKLHHGFVRSPFENLTEDQKSNFLDNNINIFENSFYKDSVEIFDYIIQVRLLYSDSQYLHNFLCNDKVVTVAKNDILQFRIINIYQEWPGNSIITSIQYKDLLWLNSDAKHIRSFLYENCSIEAYSFSGKDNQEVDALLEELEMDYSLIKPNSKLELLNKLKNYKTVVFRFCG